MNLIDIYFYKIIIKNENTKLGYSHSLNDFINEDFRMLIAGQTCCGKTNTLMQMIRKPLIYYYKFIFFHQTVIKINVKS